MARTLRSDEQLKETLASARTVAVLGAHPDPARPAHFVPAYLHEHGYRVIGVNAMHAGKKLWGEDVAPSVDALATPIDVLVIFRRADALPQHEQEILAADPRPSVVWLQLGIRNDTFAEKMNAAGIDVVQDHCAKAEHERLLGGG